ncbi:MAG: S24 family peptidase [Gemmatimonadaceae bacterium]
MRSHRGSGDDERPGFRHERGRARQERRRARGLFDPVAPGAVPTPEDREQIERDTDALLALVADYMARDPRAPYRVSLPRIRRFARNIRRAREAGGGAEETQAERGGGVGGASDELWSPRDAVLIADGIRAQVAAERSHVHRADWGLEEGASTTALPMELAFERATEAECAPWHELSVAAGAGRELWDAPCDRWVRLPSHLPRARYLALTVSGDSMTPLLHPGDVILVKLGHETTRDSIVVARHPDDGYVVKRVGAVSAEHVELTSLNRAYSPIRIPRDERLIVGTVVVRWSKHRTRGMQPG